MGLTSFIIGLTFPLTVFFCIRIVAEYERAVIFRLGRVKKNGASVGPGLFWDSVTVQVDAVVYYKIQNPMAAVCNVANYAYATRFLSATTLRNILGTKTLSELLSDREHIAADIKVMLDKATDPWGIEIERVEVKDVRLPMSLQ